MELDDEYKSPPKPRPVILRSSDDNHVGIWCANDSQIGELHNNVNHEGQKSTIRLTGTVHTELSLMPHPMDNHKFADVGAFPTEIWHIICLHLSFEDLAQLRLTCHGLAAIGAQFMVSRIRFHTSFNSLCRLKRIANHHLMRKNVKTLVYEASLLADAGCVHSYANHYDLAHHHHERPQPPTEDEPSDRAKRLYERNKKKFDKEVEQKYEAYRERYDSQQALVNGPKDEYFQCISDFPNLQEIQLRTDARCRHVLSDRFVNEFSKDCAIPMGTSAVPTLWQLEYMLQENLRKLVASTVSAKFFDGSVTRSLHRLTGVFRSLQYIRLTLRMDPADLKQVLDDNGAAASYKVLNNHVLRDALGAARDLRELSVNFIPDRTGGPATKLENVVGDFSWPKLKNVNIDFTECTQKELLEFIKRQPRLSQLEVGFFRLTLGTWVETTKRLRQDFKKLQSFIPYGMLEDEDRQYNVELVHRESWINGERLDLRIALDCYVRDHDSIEFDIDDETSYDGGSGILAFNPLEVVDEEYDEEDELEIEYGSIMDDDVFDVLGTTPPVLPHPLDDHNSIFPSDDGSSVGQSDGLSNIEPDFMDVD